jgi:Protein of unknown function (DUF2470)
MDVVDVYYVGGFGVMGWVSASDYDRGQPDPLADSMAEIIQHMNADHKDALVMLARTFAHIDSTEATMTAVDRLGFHVRLKTAEGMRGTRIAFLREVSNQGETRKVLVEMVQQARSQAKMNSKPGPEWRTGPAIFLAKLPFSSDCQSTWATEVRMLKNGRCGLVELKAHVFANAGSLPAWPINGRRKPRTMFNHRTK